MGADPTHGRSRRLRLVSWAAVGAILVGVFSTWSTIGQTTLNGTHGPNDGWLVVIVACFAVGWLRLMERTSWRGAAGALGVVGAATVVCWTAIEDWRDNREVLGASVGHGLVLVLGAGLVLAVLAGLRGVELLRASRSG